MANIKPDSSCQKVNDVPALSDLDLEVVHVICETLYQVMFWTNKLIRTQGMAKQMLEHTQPCTSDSYIELL